MDRQHLLSCFARITRAVPDQQHLVDHIGAIVGHNLGDVLIYISVDTKSDGIVRVHVNDCEIITGNELLQLYHEEHYQRLVMDAASTANAERGNEFEATIEKLQKALRHILITAKNAGDFKTDALNWIEGEAARILVDAGLETKVTLP